MEESTRYDQNIQEVGIESGPPRKSSLPPPYVWKNDCTDFPDPPEEMIEGILRKGHKMLLTGPTKVGKSYLLEELCVALADGEEWLGFKCRQSKVAYANLEIDAFSCLKRFDEIYKARGRELEHIGNLHIMNLTGETKPLNEMRQDLIYDIQDNGYELIVLDPAYKILMGDENNATEMGKFFRELDVICKETGTTVVLCHHHSKGYQVNKRAMDRGSGSGVFARDPDAILEMVEITELTERADGQKVCKVEASLREFASPPPFHILFKWPLHYRLTEADVKRLKGKEDAEDDPESKERKNGPEYRKRELDEAYEELYNGFLVSIEDLSIKMDVSDKTVVTRVKENSNEYRIVGKYVVREKDLENEKSVQLEPEE